MKKKYEFIDKQSLKLVLVGDTGVGKSSLASRLSSRPFQKEYKPTIFDNFAGKIIIKLMVNVKKKYFIFFFLSILCNIVLVCIGGKIIYGSRCI